MDIEYALGKHIEELLRNRMSSSKHAAWGLASYEEIMAMAESSVPDRLQRISKKSVACLLLLRELAMK